MFERFTSQARRTVVLSQEEARNLSHGHIGTEHLLLALLRDHDTVPGGALAAAGVRLEAVRAEIEKLIPPDEAVPSGHIPFTPRSKKVLELSLRESIKLKSRNIEPEHILLGLLREGEGLACQVLVSQGVDLSDLSREVTLRMALPGGRRSFFRTPAPQGPALTRAGVATWERAQDLAGAAPVGSQHLLLGLFGEENSLAVRALATLGVSPQAVEQALASLDAADTADEAPERAGARRTRLQVAGDMITMRVQDADLASRLSSSLRVWRRPAGGEEVELTGTEPELAEPFAKLWSAVQSTSQDILQRLGTSGADPGGWNPPGWPTQVSVAAYSVSSRAEAPAAELFIAEGVDETAVKAWLADWLTTSVPASDTACVFFTVVVGRTGDVVPNALEPDAWMISSFTAGAGPAPAEWPRVPLGDLVAFALAELRGAAPEAVD